jgi:2-C-methyl-D-erythritol 4-phosphate cytidylyltransferase
MVTALIFAGGTGERMNSKTKPKQFLEMNGKPVLIHTIEYFEQHGEVDNIVVVCLKSWIDELKKLLKRNFIHKVKWIVGGGNTGQESIYNGLNAIKDICDDSSIVLIHDGVRPLISKELISENIRCVKNFGSSITISYSNETIAFVENNDNILNIGDRNKIGIAKAPQGFYFKDIWKSHQKSKAEKINYMTDSATLMDYYGFKLHTVMSSPYNIKITTPSDYYIFRAIYEARENSQILGV